MKIHIFPFSARRETPAAEFPDQVPPNVKKERCSRLSLLERELATRYYRSLEGEELEVLVERLSETRPGWVRGTDRRYVPVELPGSAEDIGEFVTVRGELALEHCLRAAR